MNLNSPAVEAIRAWLRVNRGTNSDIMDATGFGLSTVEKATSSLRVAGDPVIANHVKRTGRGRSKDAPERLRRAAIREHQRELREQQEREKEEEEARAVREAAVRIVANALAARTPLEQVWSA